MLVTYRSIRDLIESPLKRVYPLDNTRSFRRAYQHSHREAVARYGPSTSFGVADKVMRSPEVIQL